jgi:P4 family phage/plasmid primase-like protien
MAEFKSLYAFLSAHTTDSAITHTSMKGGKYFIPEDKLDQFYTLYVDAHEDRDYSNFYLTEKPTTIGPLRVDLDFIYEVDVKEHKHTREQTTAFVKAYIETVSQYVEIPQNFDIYVMEKRKPTHEKKGNRTKSGIHLVVPDVCTHKLVEQSVRRTLIPRMGEFFDGLPLNESWEKVYDKGVVDRSVNWTLYMSKKNDKDDVTRPYEIQYLIHYSEGQFVLNTQIPDVNVDLMKKLSMRQSDEVESPMTENGKSLYSTARDKNAGNADGETRKRGRTFQRTDKTSSRASSPSARIIQPLTPERKDYLQAHTMNLDKSRYEDYDKWVQVGICLFNIHPDLLDVFLDFSSQWEKYNESDCIQKWNSLTFRNDGDRIGEPTLRYWSREDNRSGYDQIEENNVDKLVLKACSNTEFDVAMLIFAKFRDHYKCSDFRYNVWYRWMGHIWRRTEQGVDLQLKLSKDIAKVFEDAAERIKHEMETDGLTCCVSPSGKEDCKLCMYCVKEAQKLALMKMYLRMKSTGFKTNVMRECRELFFDEQFGKKLDTNKDLISFNNGVLDLITFEFRPGKQEDCISFSTGIDYDPDRPYYEYPTWPKVEKFIQQVLPKKEVRDYFIKHLASNLFGGNTAQKFHILTGSGSNGKSMIMNLMTKTMGDYACTVPISLFTQKRKSSGSAAPEVARLRGRRFVTMQEPDEAIALNTGLMKEISSGEKMYARDLFESGSEFEVLAKFHLACNEKPKVNTIDGGTWRRLVVINFLSKFVVSPAAANEFPLDESIQFSVNSPEWATPFLSYLVHVLREGQGLRKLVAPPDVLEYTSDYRNENDAIAKFISEKIVASTEGETVEKTALRRTFKAWKDENDQRSLQPQDMEKRIIELFGKYPSGGWKNFQMV